MYCRFGNYSIDAVLPFVIQYGGKWVGNRKRDADYKTKLKRDYDGHIVKMDSLRYVLFEAKGLTCVECGVEGQYFGLEAFRQTCIDQDDPTCHFNLYGLKNGQEVMLTKDHVLPKAQGGTDKLDNLQVMCFDCNQAKADQLAAVQIAHEDHKKLQETIAEYNASSKSHHKQLAMWLKELAMRRRVMKEMETIDT